MIDDAGKEIENFPEIFKVLGLNLEKAWLETLSLDGERIITKNVKNQIIMSTIKVFNDLYEFKEIHSANSYFNTSSKEQKIEALLEGLSFNHYNTVETIFIAFPQLWRDLSKDDWSSLLEKSILKLSGNLLDIRVINNSDYAFFRIMGKYLNINAFQLAKDNSFLTNALKTYGRNYSSLFYVENETIIDELNDYEKITFNELRLKSAQLEKRLCASTC